MTEDQTERLTAYLDGQLTPEQVRQLEDELDQSEQLRHLLGELRIVREYMRKVGPESAPQGFLERVMDAVDMDAARGARRASLSMPMLSMLAAAAMLFVMYNFVQQLQPAPSVGAAPPEAVKTLESAPVQVAPGGTRLDGPVYMAPAAYRFRGPGALQAVAEAAAAQGGRLVDQTGSPTAAPNDKGEIWLEIDAPQVARFRQAMEGKAAVESIGIGQVIEGKIKLRLLIVQAP